MSDQRTGPGSPHPTGHDDDLVAVLERWESFGGRWRVLARSGDAVTIGLLSCDSGEQMGRVAGSSDELDGYVSRGSQGDH